MCGACVEGGVVHVWRVECVHVWRVECVHVWRVEVCMCGGGGVHVWRVECVHVMRVECVHVWSVECVQCGGGVCMCGVCCVCGERGSVLHVQCIHMHHSVLTFASAKIRFAPDLVEYSWVISGSGLRTGTPVAPEVETVSGTYIGYLQTVLNCHLSLCLIPLF